MEAKYIDEDLEREREIERIGERLRMAIDAWITWQPRG